MTQAIFISSGLAYLISRSDFNEKTMRGLARFAQSGKVFALEEDCLVSLIFFMKRK